MNKTEKTKWVGKSWGGELIITNRPQYCGKILYCMKGLRASVHYHNVKNETFWLSKGLVKIYYTDDLKKLMEILKDENVLTEMKKDPGYFMDYVILDQGAVFYVPPKRVHCVEALENSELVEISTQFFEEDSVRLLKFT